MDLEKYCGKKVRITTKKNKVVIGFASHYESPEDNDEDGPALTLTHTGIGTYVEAREDEIKKIEVID